MTPRFDIIQSNRLELLAERLCNDLGEEPLSSPLAKELIIVQDPSVGRWLELSIARTSGIAANLRFLSPAQCFADLYRSLDPMLRAGSPYDPEILRWRLLALLADRRFTAAYPELDSYLKGGDLGRTFDLSGRIAQVFGTYLTYRMDWLAEWEANREGGRGNDERWQAALWRRVVASIQEPHHGRLFGRLVTSLENGLPGCPERISVFGINSLSPAYATLLRAAGRKAAVRLYAVNPCRQEWGEIADERNVVDVENTPDLLHFEVPHALLGSLGKQGRDFMGIVYERAGEGAGTIDLFEAPGEDTLLHFIQSGILNLVEGRHSPGPDDRSIQVHRCHTPMREVQVLRDRLLDLFDHDPTLKPSDIIVLAPDINVYAPYIDAVFSAFHDEAVPLPVEIADRIPAQMNPVVEAWLALMELQRSRFEADAVVNLLRLAPLASAFEISSDEIDRMSTWVEESGIRWGIDGAQKKTFGLPEDPLFTWSWGLDRLVLGVALPRSVAGGDVFHGYLPADLVEGAEIDLLDRFVRFAATLKEWTEELGKSRSMERWGDVLGRWLDRFFPGGKEISEQREEIRAAIEHAVAGSIRASYGEPVDYAVIRQIMQGSLGEDRSGLRFHSGGVIFSSMRPMRALPFRIVCLLGLSDGEFPRDRSAPAFDLMRRYYRHGDRSSRMDDRYLFLELLLSARDTLYLSYVGEDVFSGKNLPPSPIVGEFLDFVVKVATEAGAAVSPPGSTPRERALLLVRHPLQSFSPAYFDGKNPSLFSYSATDLRTTRAISAGPCAERIVFPAPLPLPAEFSRKIRIEELCEFIANPARYLFTRRLNIRYRSDDDVLEGSEPLVVGKAETRSIRSALVEGLGKGELQNAADFRRLFERLTADAQLPPGLAGKTGYEGQLQEMAPILEAYRTLLRKERLDRAAGSVKLGEWELEVEISTGLTADGLHHAKPGELRGKDILSFWTRFLATSLVHPNVGALEGSLLGIRRNANKEIQPDLLVFRRDSDAAEVLSALLRWYEIGICRPIRLLPETSWAYAKELDAKGDPGGALEKAKAAWIPADEDFGFREGNDEYFSRLFPPDETALDAEFLQITETFAVRAHSALLTGGKPVAPRSRKKK